MCAHVCPCATCIHSFLSPLLRAGDSGLGSSYEVVDEEVGGPGAEHALQAGYGLGSGKLACRDALGEGPLGVSLPARLGLGVEEMQSMRCADRGR